MTDSALNISFISPLQQRAIAATQVAQQNNLLRTVFTRITKNQPLSFTNNANYSIQNFSSNDYLGLSQHPKIIESLTQCATYYGVGSGASHLITGHCQIHSELEQALAQWLNREKVLLFSTGYMANLAVISTLLSRHDVLFQDKLNHASLIDAGILSRAKNLRYPHGNLKQLEQLLITHKTTDSLIASDGIFSMEGDIAPLNHLAQLAQKYHSSLMIDDAHGIGVIGPEGKGCCDYYQLNTQEVPILVGTLGKAFGTFGAFVAGDTWLIDYLTQFARPYIYTTALPPSIAAATLTSLQLIQTETWRREKLHELIAYFKQKIQPLCLRHPYMQLLPSPTAIQALVIGSTEQTLQISHLLKSKGFWVSAIRPPTVPKNTNRLRITLNSLHDKVTIDTLIKVLDQALIKHKTSLTHNNLTNTTGE